MRCIDAAAVLVYDGMDPWDWNAPLPHPAARGLSLAALDQTPWERFAATIDPAVAAQMAHTAGLRFGEGPWGGWRGRDDARATTAVALDPVHGTLRLVACVGEFQPARWRAWVLGVWTAPDLDGRANCNPEVSPAANDPTPRP